MTAGPRAEHACGGPFTTAKGFDFGAKSFVMVGDLTGMRVDAAYVGQNTMSAGGGPGSAGSAVGSSYSTFTFGRDGRFVRGRSTATMATVPGVAFSGSSSEGETAGRYAFEGNTLVLTHEDGTTESVLVRAGDEGWARGDPAPTFLTIGGLLHGLEG